MLARRHEIGGRDRSTLNTRTIIGNVMMTQVTVMNREQRK
jgi:hypothetical protein